MNIQDYLSMFEFKTREQLVRETGLSDRTLRQKISDLKQKMPVIYNSQTKGYRLAKTINKEMSKEELEHEIKLIRHCINDIEARKDVFNKQEREYIAYLKVAEKIKEEI